MLFLLCKIEESVDYYNEEKFLELFEECGEIESVKIIEGQNDDG